MKKSTDIALSILAGTVAGTAGGILLAFPAVYIFEKVIDRYEKEAYQKVWNAGKEAVEAVVEVAVAVAEVIEEEITNG